MSNSLEDTDEEPALPQLPAPPQFLRGLIRSIGSISVDASVYGHDGGDSADDHNRLPPQHLGHHHPNPLALVPHADRPLLATLHVLFPALLLPALDLLDRRRVVRWGRPPSGEAKQRTRSALYQIRGDTPHVVHLRAWHCTCAFFALRAAATKQEEQGEAGRADALAEYAFSTPPCKHLLACLLAEQWPALRTCVVSETDCSPEVFAGVVTGDW